MDFEVIIGLETHVELSTKTKIFCSCENSFGGEPNSKCCEVCMGFPGSLPHLNGKVVEFGVMAGHTFGCDINSTSYMARKNYVYPDLPKGYQITQGDVPLCENGSVMLSRPLQSPKAFAPIAVTLLGTITVFNSVFG